MKELKCFYLLLLVTVIVNGQPAKETDTKGESPKGKSEIANTKIETESKSDTSKPEGSSLKAFLNRVKSESNYGRFDSKAGKTPERAAYLSKIKNIMKVRENSGGSTSPRIGVGTGGSVGGPYGQNRFKFGPLKGGSSAHSHSGHENDRPSRENSGGSTSPRIGVGTGGSVGGPYGQNRFNFGPLKSGSSAHSHSGHENDRPSTSYRPTPHPHYTPGHHDSHHHPESVPLAKPYNPHPYEHHRPRPKPTPHNDYKPKPRPRPEPEPEHTPEKTYTYSPHLHLTNQEYKHIWLEMLREIYKIMSDKHLIYDTKFITHIFDKLMNLLNDINVLDDHTNEDSIDCPKTYTKSGGVCLVADKLSSFLKYDEARLYCQVVHGGDLAISRDANEYADIQNFIQQVDGMYEYSFFIGISDEANNNDWRWIDGTAAPKGAPYWGIYPGDCDALTNLCKRKRRTGKAFTSALTRTYVGPMVHRSDANDLVHLIHPATAEPESEDENYGVLNKFGHHYIYPASNEDAENWSTVPLCQFIPERDQKNFQYGEGIYEEWKESNAYDGWSGEDQDTGTIQGTQFPHYHDNEPWRRSANKNRG